MTASSPRASDACDFLEIHARDVTRRYGRRRALANLSLDCRSGSVLGVFGPNGSGKSTLLALLSTLARPSAGEITYGDQTAAQWGDALRGRVGILGHDLFLYSDLTAAENLMFFARLYDLHDVDRRVTSALEIAKLDTRRADRVSSFSRGMRQRLAFERALLHEPRLVVLDEPFTGLDDESAVLLVERLRDLRTRGAIVVMATHDFDTAAEVVDEALCLVDGRAIAMPAGVGSLRERYRAAVHEVRR